MKIFIITEGGRRMGFGHLTRCMGIYEAFEERRKDPFFIVNGDESVKGLFKGKRYKIFDWLKQKRRLYKIIEGSDMVVVDSYLAKPDIYKNISRLTRKAVWLDDDRRINYPDGVVLNGSMGARYVLLRREFWRVPRRRIKKIPKCVIITFGGDDSRGMTSRVLNVLTRRFPRLLKKVVIGRGFRQIEFIKGASDAKTELLYYPDAAGIKRAMLDADIAISAGGQTLGELARCGVPTIAVAIAENQSVNIEGWKKAGFIEYAGRWDEDGIFGRIHSILGKFTDYDLRTKKSEAGRRSVDGRGSRRVVDYLLRGL